MADKREPREQRRRSFGDDHSDFADAGPEPRYFQRPPQAAASDALDAEVLWFNADKGFGFVKTTDGAEAFLHIRALESAGHGSVAQGAQLKVTLQDAPKGKQVSQVLEVRGGAAPAPAASQRPPRQAPRSFQSSGQSSGQFSGQPSGPEQEREGTVKWYNPDKGFGFISLGGVEKDVFVHATALTRSGLSVLTEGQQVIVTVAQGQKGPEARSVRPA